MEKIHFFENVALALTTYSLEDYNLLGKLTDKLKLLFDVEDLLVTFQTANLQDNKMLLSNTASEYLIEACSQINSNGKAGGLVFSDEHCNSFILRYEWRKYKSDKLKKMIESNKVKHNEISLQFDASSIASAKKKQEFIELCMFEAKAFDVDYMKVANLKFDRRGNLGKNDLSNGIHDIYWLNVFGKPFIEVIGRERLLSSPAWNIVEINDCKVLLQATEEICSHHGLGSEILDKIRSHIGEMYFSKSKSICKQNSGIFTVTDLMKYMWSVVKTGNDVEANAEVCPCYDYSRMAQ